MNMVYHICCTASCKGAVSSSAAHACCAQDANKTCIHKCDSLLRAEICNYKPLPTAALLQSDATHTALALLCILFAQIYVYDCRAKYTLSAVIATQNSASTAIDFSADGRYIKVCTLQWQALH
jgi:hypothetical protein